MIQGKVAKGHRLIDPTIGIEVVGSWCSSLSEVLIRVQQPNDPRKSGRRMLATVGWPYTTFVFVNS